MKQDTVLRSANGGYLTAQSDTNREHPDYLTWVVAPGHAFGVVANTPETRRILEDILRRFRRDASRLKARAKKQLTHEESRFVDSVPLPRFDK